MPDRSRVVGFRLDQGRIEETLPTVMIVVRSVPLRRRRAGRHGMAVLCVCQSFLSFHLYISLVFFPSAFSSSSLVLSTKVLLISFRALVFQPLVSLHLFVVVSAWYPFFLCCRTQNTNAEYCSPLTSFDWCEADPSTVGTSSIDTTCTIWDVAVSDPLFLCLPLLLPLLSWSIMLRM